MTLETREQIYQFAGCVTMDCLSLRFPGFIMAVYSIPLLAVTPLIFSTIWACSAMPILPNHQFTFPNHATAGDDVRAA